MRLGVQHRFLKGQIGFLLLRVGQIYAGLDAAEIEQRLQELARDTVREGRRFEQVF